MKRAFVVLLIALPMAGHLLAQSPPILETKFERQQGPPLWISAEAVADPQEIIKLDLIEDIHLQSNVQQQRKALGARATQGLKAGEMPPIGAISQIECKSDTLSAELRGGEHPSASLVDLAAYSKSIVRGLIRSIAPGFASGVPAQLLTVEITEAIKGELPRSAIFVTYPVARFRIGPFFFCNAEKGFEPRPGDEVLLFDYMGPIDRDQALYAPRLDQLFFESQSGQLFVTPHLRKTPALQTLQTLDDVVRLLRASGTSVDSQGRPE